MENEDDSVRTDGGGFISNTSDILSGMQNYSCERNHGNWATSHSLILGNFKSWCADDIFGIISFTSLSLGGFVSEIAGSHRHMPWWQQEEGLPRVEHSSHRPLSPGRDPRWGRGRATNQNPPRTKCHRAQPRVDTSDQQASQRRAVRFRVWIRPLIRE